MGQKIFGRMQILLNILDFIIYWSIVIIPFSVAIAPALTFTFIGFMSFGFLLKKLIKRERLFISTAINLPFLFLILAAVLSFGNSLYYKESFRGIVKLLQNSVIFLICAEEIRDTRHVKRIIASIIFGASLASFDAIWQMVFGHDFIRGNPTIIHIGNLRRATAAFPHPNTLGVYLSITATLIAGLSLYYFRGRKHFFMLLTSALVVAGLALTFSRPAALAFYLCILLTGIIKKRKIIVGMLLTILLLIPFIAPKDIKNWVKGIGFHPVVLMCNYDRISIYRNTLNMIRHHPLIGVGVNTFSRNYRFYKLPEAKGAQTGESMYGHNNFLHMAGEIGLMGLGVFLWLLFRLFKKCGQIYRNVSDEYIKVISLCLAVSLVAFLLNGLTETSLYSPRVAMIFWYFIGLSLSLDKFSIKAQF